MAGMIAIFMSFAGQFAFFLPIFSGLYEFGGLDVDGLTLVLLSFGIASFSNFSSYVLKRSKTGAGRRAAATGVLSADAHVGRR